MTNSLILIYRKASALRYIFMRESEMLMLVPKAKPESVYFLAALWHEPCMAQCAQFAPQVDLPCFLHFLKYTTIAAITAIKTRATTIVDRFSAKNVNMINPPYSVFSICEKRNYFKAFSFSATLTFPENLPASLYGLNS